MGYKYKVPKKINVDGIIMTPTEWSRKLGYSDTYVYTAIREKGVKKSIELIKVKLAERESGIAPKVTNRPRKITVNGKTLNCRQWSLRLFQNDEYYISNLLRSKDEEYVKRYIAALLLYRKKFPDESHGLFEILLKNKGFDFVEKCLKVSVLNWEELLGLWSCVEGNSCKFIKSSITEEQINQNKHLCKLHFSHVSRYFTNTNLKDALLFASENPELKFAIFLHYYVWVFFRHYNRHMEHIENNPFLCRKLLSDTEKYMSNFFSYYENWCYVCSEDIILDTINPEMVTTKDFLVGLKKFLNNLAS